MTEAYLPLGKVDEREEVESESRTRLRNLTQKMPENETHTITERATTSAPPEEGAKARIMAAAVTLFCQKGYESTSVREIVEAAGVSKPVLYYYFKDKQDLFRQIITGAVEQYQRQMNALCADDNALELTERLRAILNIYVAMGRTEPDLIRFLHSIAFSGFYDDVFDFHEFWKDNFRRLVGVFERAQRDGWVRDDIPAETLAYTFMAIAEANMRGHAYCPEVMDDPDGDAHALEALWRGIAKSGSNPDGPPHSPYRPLSTESHP